MSYTARIFTQEQLTDALASACVLEGVSILHRFQQADKDRRNLKAVAKTICAICGAPLTDTTSSICPDCQELEKDW